jgi:hypothetical protein
MKLAVVLTKEGDIMALEIKYNGKTIAILEKGQTATIPCDGKKMATDIVVSISASVNLISFTIGGRLCQAEEGMTWGEWQASGYNKAGVDKSLRIDGLSVAWNTGYAVSSSDAIVAGHQYYLPVGDIGGSN